VTFRWSIDGAAAVAGQGIMVGYPDQGTHTAVLTVCDSNGTCSSDGATITVRNVAPVITSRSSTPVLTRVNTELSPLPGATATFTLSVTDVAADPPVYRWSFGDGAAATTTIGAASRTYTRLGSFTVTVTADDGDGGTATAQWVVNNMATGSCNPAAKDNNKRFNTITAAWGGVGATVTVPGNAPTFTVPLPTKKNKNPAPVSTGLEVIPGDVMTLQRSGPTGPDFTQLQIACGPGGTRYLQAFIPRLNQTLYLQEAALIRI
jgi:hypothetical protein